MHCDIIFCFVLIININLTFSLHLRSKFIEKQFSKNLHNNDLQYEMGLEHQQTTEDLIKEAGFVAERHELRTEDGYWLVLHRIPHSEGKPAEPNKTAIILQHGLLGSSASWVLNGRNNSLGFILADEGYDVWLPNIRGNTYSRRHEFLDPKIDAPSFWNYSFHEMGTLDLPAIIDYILHSTGHSQVMYVGHSMGTTMAYVMLSMRPEYNQKLKVFVSMAPVAYLGHIKSPIVKFLTFADPLLLRLLNNFRVHEVLPHNKWIKFLDQHLCQNSTLSYTICITIMESLSGFDTAQLDMSILHKILKHFPAGTSVKVLQHYSQLIKGGRFCQYDYGWKGNYYQYQGSFTPPDYDLKNIVAPNFMYHGRNDWLSNREDVDRLFDELPNIVGKTEIRYKKFNHFDFLFAKDIKELVYDSLVNVLSRF